MYMSFLLTVVEYASVVWDGCSEQGSQTLQKIQNEAARLVTGLTRSVSLENPFKNIFDSLQLVTGTVLRW